MFKKKGSAYLMVLGAITVLIIIAFSLLRSKNERAFSTKYLSNEKKAEALAEAAVDLLGAYIRKTANKHDFDGDSSLFYHLFRTPLKLKGSKLSTSDGSNLTFDLSDMAPLPAKDQEFSPLSPLKYMIDELGGNERVKIEVICSMPQAEGFTAISKVSGNYDVVGITEKSIEAKGDSAKFLDSIDNSPKNDGTISGSKWGPSSWELDVNLPSLTSSDVKKFKVKAPWPIGKVTVTLTLTKKTKTKIRIQAEAVGLEVYDKTIDCLDYVDDFIPGVNPLNMTGLRRKVMPGSDGAISKSYKADKFASIAKDEFGKVDGPIPSAKLEKNSFGSNPRVVEKGALFEIKAKVEYYPFGKNKKMVTRVLVAQLPFKVTDVQPIAPEYTFFAANSPLIKENAPISGANGGKIDLNVADGASGVPASAVGYFVLHNVPSVPDGTGFAANYTNITGFDLGADDKAMIPGMVRINGKGSGANRMKLHTFIGTFEEPDLTELNIMCSPFSETDPNVNKFQTKPAFQWYPEPYERGHEVEFPVLFDDDIIYAPVAEKGCTGIMKIYEEGGLSLMMVPTLLYGMGHMEYPLGIRPEGPIDMVFGKIKVSADPKAKASLTNVKDLTEIYIDYKNPDKYFDGSTAKFGMQGYPAYESESEWDPTTNFKVMPANCYSLLQYSKKANHFYASESEFKTAMGLDVSDGGLKNPDGSIDINGVIYIKGSLTISSPLVVKGKGLIVAKTDIILNANVTRKDDDTVFGLIARGGTMEFRGCSKVEAACFSNGAPTTTTSSEVVINGNLVCNAFDRRKIIDLKVFYNSRACTVNPLSVIRDVGKYSPERYWVSFAENWSRFSYEKIK